MVQALLLSYLGVAVLMILLWYWQARSGRGSIVDVFWTLGVTLIALVQLLLVPVAPGPRHWLASLLISCWGLRLTLFLAWRMTILPEDGRYLELQERWGATRARRMFFFFQFQAFGTVLFAWPFILLAGNQYPLGILDLVGTLFWMTGILGGTIADFQMTRFRHTAGNEKRVCAVGLWKYSRHPNYFFEWIHWCSYVFLAWLAPWGWLTLLAPLTLLLLIFFVTGIPPSEKQALMRRGESYLHYQARTPVFIPWFPRPTDE